MLACDKLSFLCRHVYHHSTVVFPCWWAAVNFAPGGDVYFTCALNSFVHVLMWVHLGASAVLALPVTLRTCH